jgi:hypothetical protein
MLAVVATYVSRARHVHQEPVRTIFFKITIIETIDFQDVVVGDKESERRHSNRCVHLLILLIFEFCSDKIAKL